jgi:capsular exopolysaccharide synthesis family protein
MTVADYIAVLRRNIVLIASLMVVFGVGAYVYAQTLPRLYRSYASVMVVPEQGGSTSELVQGSNYVQGIVQSYAMLAETPYVLQPVIDDLKLNTTPARLAESITVESPLNSTIIQVSVIWGSPETAQRIAQEVTTELTAAVRDLSPKVGNKPAVRLTTISPATLPTVFISPDTRLFLLGGVGAGLVIGVIAAFLLHQLRLRPSTTDELSSVTDLPVLGEVPRVHAESLPAEVLASPGGQAAEAVRSIAAGLRFVSIDEPANVIVVTSSRPSDGKTSIAVSLSLTLAEAGRRTLLIDADLRNPSVARMIGLEGSVGLTTTLVQDCTLDEAIQPWAHDNLVVLPSGAKTPNPGQLVSSGQLGELLAQARHEYDSIVIDTAPVLAVSDALWVAPHTDGVILVARARKTPATALRSAIDAVASTHVRTLGVVLNGSRVRSDNRYHESGPTATQPRRGALRRRVG